jgi:hypothetical protein
MFRLVTHFRKATRRGGVKTDSSSSSERSSAQVREPSGKPCGRYREGTGKVQGRYREGTAEQCAGARALREALPRKCLPL